jgi:hypothetical protein
MIRILSFHSSLWQANDPPHFGRPASRGSTPVILNFLPTSQSHSQEISGDFGTADAAFDKV